MVVWFSETAIAVDDGTGVAIVTLTDKRWLPPDPEFTPALGLYVGAVGALKAAPEDGGHYLHMAGWRVLDLQCVLSIFVCAALSCPAQHVHHFAAIVGRSDQGVYFLLCPHQRWSDAARLVMWLVDWSWTALLLLLGNHCWCAHRLFVMLSSCLCFWVAFSDVALADELWVAEVIDIHLSTQSANGAT